MALRFFKKLSPNTPVVLTTGTRVSFTTLNHLVGYFATDNEGLQKEFETAMGQNRGGITEITEAEFKADYLEKKNNCLILKPLSREEVGAGAAYSNGNNPIAVLGTAAVRAQLAVKGDGAKPLAVTMEDPPKEVNTPVRLSKETPAADFNPPVGRRKKRT